MGKQKEVFKKESEIERDGNVNLSVGKQKTLKVILKGGKYDGICTEVPHLKGLNMIGFGKAEEAGPKVKVIPSEQHENESRKNAMLRKELKEVETRQTK